MTLLVTVITPTTGCSLLARAMASVAAQSYKPIQHMVVIDGAECGAPARSIIAGRPVDVIELPYATGRDKFNGHRIYGAGTFLCRGDVVCFLDEDNWMDRDHIESLVNVLMKGNEWAYSLRKIVDQDGNLVCFDNCESLGKWPSVLSDRDYLVDVNCFMLPKVLALKLTPLWYRKARTPGVSEVDRVLTKVLREKTQRFDSNYRYSLNYCAGRTSTSVRASFFLKGNAVMERRFPMGLPWSPLSKATQ
ncbi:Glycosyltransferase [Candidatus Filomicrobium marinum]|uniref:Glycosyltransferase n=1 Tax=Candidatus Filomicrobium marinum TaxID=1608628 RepID=A0A0D6JC42_9HYPH|nr:MULTISPECIES: glycosyltransferase family A protein [Filomicrobium]CFX08674.1 Glycosyltransferase [Candidatus Filomicrobium marinum]CPR16826.1 Glycosyltransferase [Candidatus Filomicrobium marinum]